MTNFRGSHSQFGLKRVDRGRHVYIVGQTGTGKSGLLELLTLSDVFHNHGFAVIDPHGDYAADILRYIPAHRLKMSSTSTRLILEFPIGFNPMEVTDPSLKEPYQLRTSRCIEAHVRIMGSTTRIHPALHPPGALGHPKFNNAWHYSNANRTRIQK
jgi:hypothetical protein